MSNETHFHELLPAYALDILTEVETAQVDDHLATCAACQAELRQYQTVADELPLALVQATPRPALKMKLMKEIHHRRQKTVSSFRPSLIQSWGSFLRRSFPAWGLALIAVLALGNLLLWRRTNLVSGRNASSMRVVALANTKDSPQAVGSLMINPSGEYGTLVVDRLPVLDIGHQYQVWLIRGDQRISGGLFSANADGYASLELAAPLPLNLYQSVGITIEPAGGSPGPTGAKVLGGNLLP
jgi:anti-sigma-K factor RskA